MSSQNACTVVSTCHIQAWSLTPHFERDTVALDILGVGPFDLTSDVEDGLVVVVDKAAVCATIEWAGQRGTTDPLRIDYGKSELVQSEQILSDLYCEVSSEVVLGALIGACVIYIVGVYRRGNVTRLNTVVCELFPRFGCHCLSFCCELS